MSEQDPADPYDVVLADLFSKRDQIDAAISAIQALRGGVTSSGRVSPSPPSDSSTASNDAGAYLGLSIVEAAKKLLATRRRALSNQDVAVALKAGGLVLTSADPQNTIGSVLTRRFNQVGDIVRVDRGTWGLAEWYPNRNFKPKGGKAEGNGEGVSADPSASAPPSVPEPPAPQE